MKPKHTPGPWKFDYDRTIRQDAPGNAGFPITDVVYGRVDEDQMANGHILAAAPDMLETLKAIAHECNGDGHFPLMGMVLDAIAKAEGRS